MKTSVLRSTSVGAAVTLSAAAVICYYLLRPAPQQTPREVPLWFTIVVSLMLGTVPGAFAATATFCWLRYPDVAKTATIAATVGCLLLDGVIIYGGASLTDGAHIVIWLLWPVFFLSWLLVRVKHAVAKRVLDEINSRVSS